VETYGSLGKEEKVDFILEQIRLTLAKKDFIRTFIIAKKVRPAGVCVLRLQLRW
jgi:26S proteasome regulatory subunit N5